MKTAAISALLALAGFGLTAADAAAAFTGRFGAQVNPVQDSVFEVVLRRAGGASEYWCGAAEYAVMALGAGWDARIFVARGRGASETTGRKTAVQFTMDPGAAGVTPIPPFIFPNAFRVGDNMTVGQAFLDCNIRPPIRF